MFDDEVSTTVELIGTIVKCEGARLLLSTFKNTQIDRQNASVLL